MGHLPINSRAPGACDEHKVPIPSRHTIKNGTDLTISPAIREIKGIRTPGL